MKEKDAYYARLEVLVKQASEISKKMGLTMPEVLRNLAEEEGFDLRPADPSERAAALKRSSKKPEPPACQRKAALLKGHTMKRSLPTLEEPVKEKTNGRVSTDTPPEFDRLKIVRPDQGIIRLTVRGKTPLVQNAFSEKAKRMMAEKQKGNIVKKEFKNPKECFENSMYKMKDGSPAFKTVPFKCGMIQVAPKFKIKRDIVRGSVFIKGEYVKLECSEPEMREDMVRVYSAMGGGVADVRYRAEFKEWACQLEIEYDRRHISAEHIVNLLIEAGNSNGIGEMRPQKTAFDCGRYDVDVDSVSVARIGTK